VHDRFIDGLFNSSKLHVTNKYQRKLKG